MAKSIIKPEAPAAWPASAGYVWINFLRRRFFSREKVGFHGWTPGFCFGMTGEHTKKSFQTAGGMSGSLGFWGQRKNWV